MKTRTAILCPECSMPLTALHKGTSVIATCRHCNQCFRCSVGGDGISTTDLLESPKQDEHETIPPEKVFPAREEPTNYLRMICGRKWGHTVYYLEQK